MELDRQDTMGYLQYEVTLAMTPDDWQQIVLAASLAVAHGIDVPILDTLVMLDQDTPP